jgi:hypothetical protein
MKQSDIFVILDTVQYSKNSFDNRNRIRIDGGDKWLTIPMHTKGMFGKSYREIEPVDYKWIGDHLKTIEYAYRKAPYFNHYFPAIKEVYATYLRMSMPKEYEGAKLLLPLIAKTMFPVIEDVFNINPKVMFASELSLYGEKSSDLILAICKKLEATEYYAGKMSLDYLKHEEFEKEGIKVILQTYQPQNNYAFIHQLFMNGAIL